MFVLSVEGGGHIDRELWVTHKILGVFQTKEEALESDVLHDEEIYDDDIVLLTDTTTGHAQNVITT